MTLDKAVRVDVPELAVMVKNSADHVHGCRLLNPPLKMLRDIFSALSPDTASLVV